MTDGPSGKARNTTRMVVLIIFILGLALLHTFVFRRYVTDDAFISFRYLENLLDGNGLVYNLGERVWGFTNFLWIALLAPGVGLGIDPLLVSRILGVGFNAGTLILVVLFRLKTQDRPGMWDLGAGLLLISNGAFLLQGLSGLETSFFTFLVVLTLFFYRCFLDSRNLNLLIWIGILAAVSTLTRPEGLFYFGLFCVHILSEHRRLDFPPIRFLGRPLLGFVPLVGGFVLSAYLYYGSLWPNSIDAKVGLSGEQVLRGLHYLKVFARGYPFSLFLVVLALVFIKKTGILERFLIQLSFFIVVFNVVVGGDWMLGYRLFHALIPLSCLLLPFVFMSLEELLRAWKIKPFLLTLPLLGCGVLLNLSGSLYDNHVRRAAEESYVHEGVVVGKWMRENLEPGALLATNTAGTIAYYSRLPIVDMMGLNDKVIAGRKDVPALWKGIEKGDGAYVLSRRPDYIQLGSSIGSDGPRFLSDCEIFQSREFWDHYKRDDHEVTEDITLILFKRRQKPRQKPLSEQRWQNIERRVINRILRSAFRY
jgi:arabinofuranosyltransferase